MAVKLMGFFTKTLEHIEEGAANAAGKLKQFYEKEKPKVAAFIEKEEEAIKKGGEHLKEYVAEHKPKVEAWLANEARTINDLYERGELGHAEHKEHMTRHYRHRDKLSKRERELIALSRQQIIIQQAPPQTAGISVQSQGRLGYGMTEVRSHERTLPSGGVIVVRKHKRECLMYQGKTYCEQRRRKTGRSKYYSRGSIGFNI